MGVLLPMNASYFRDSRCLLSRETRVSQEDASALAWEFPPLAQARKDTGSVQKVDKQFSRPTEIRSKLLHI